MPTNNNWDNQIAAANSPITLNSGTNGVNLSTDAAATVVSVATGGANKTLTLGSANTTSTTNIQSGSGGINIPAFTEGALVTSSAGRVSSVDGSIGEVLTANAAGIAPSFQPLGPGSRTLIQSQTVFNVLSCDFTMGISGYTYYVLECLEYYFNVTDNLILTIEFSTDGGATWNFFTYAQFNSACQTGTMFSVPVYRALGTAAAFVGQAINGIQGTSVHNILAPGYGIMKLYGLGSSSTIKQTTFSGADRSNDMVGTEQLLGVSATTATTIVNGIRIAQDGASTILFSGTFRLYGVA